MVEWLKSLGVIRLRGQSHVNHVSHVSHVSHVHTARRSQSLVARVQFQRNP